MSVGLDRTNKDLSKRHGPPPMNTLFFSSSVANLNKKMLSPMLSILTSFTVLHTCCIAAFKPFLLMLHVSNTLLTRQFATTFSPFIFMLPIIITMSFASSVLLLWQLLEHFRINSSVSMYTMFPAIKAFPPTSSNTMINRTQKKTIPNFNRRT